jgi:hypothetical protein
MSSLSQRQARRYMQVASEASEVENGRRQPFQSRTLTEALGDVRTWPDRSFRSVASQTITMNVERLNEERQSREHEAKLMKQLAHQLVDIGYRVLAARLHPDKGGSHEAMARLNNVRRRLKEAV